MLNSLLTAGFEEGCDIPKRESRAFLIEFPRHPTVPRAWMLWRLVDPRFCGSCATIRVKCA